MALAPYISPDLFLTHTNTTHKLMKRVKLRVFVKVDTVYALKGELIGRDPGAPRRAALAGAHLLHGRDRVAELRARVDAGNVEGGQEAEVSVPVVFSIGESSEKGGVSTV
jgi:hypothetical protein